MNCSCEDCEVTENFADIFTQYGTRKCLSIEAQWIVAVLTTAGFLIGLAVIECGLLVYYGHQLCQNYIKNRPPAVQSKPRRSGVQVLELDEVVGESACSEENVIDHYRAQQGEYTVRVTDAKSERYTQHTTPAQDQSEALYDRLIEVPVTVEQTSPYAYATSGRAAGTESVPLQRQHQASKCTATTPAATVYNIQNDIEGDYAVIRV